jgi:hypothetical protein
VKEDLLIKMSTTNSPAPAVLSAIQAVLSGLGGLYNTEKTRILKLIQNRQIMAAGNTHNIPRNLTIMQTLSALTLKRNIPISKNAQYQSIHRRFLELASPARGTAKGGWAFDLVFEKVADVWWFMVRR